MKLGVALGWHALAFEELLGLVRRAEASGYAAAYVDGDVSQLESRGEGDVLDGWTVTTALLAQTSGASPSSLPAGTSQIVPPAACRNCWIRSTSRSETKGTTAAAPG